MSDLATLRASVDANIAVGDQYRVIRTATVLELLDAIAERDAKLAAVREARKQWHYSHERECKVIPDADIANAMGES